jgi:molecular chaperone HscA
MAKISIDLQKGVLSKKEWILGIDLGTTNSLVAVVDSESGLPKTLMGESDASVIVPSILHMKDGKVAQVGADARPYLISDPENTVYSVKRLMGKSFGDVKEHQNHFGFRIIDEDEDKLLKIETGGRYYSPMEFSAEILKVLKKRAGDRLKSLVSKAVITVPAYFNDAQRQATRDAGKLAGLDVLRILNEPTAASLAYGIGLDKNDNRTVAVYDLGGGTFDISILRIQQGIFEVLSTHGNTYLGGDDIDRAIAEHWMKESSLDQKSLYADKSKTQELRLLAEEAKVKLNDQEEIDFPFEFNGDIYNLTLNLKTLIELMKPLIDSTLESCRSALKDSKLTISEIDDIVMVGGSTKSPVIKNAVKQFFAKTMVNDSLNPDEVVALGAAVEADILAGNRRDILLLDVTPLSLGIETIGGLMDVMITRNSRIPVKASRQYTTSVDGQVNLKIAVYQGERDLVAQNRKLAEFDLKRIPAMPAGLPKVEITFMLNADGILVVSAIELRSGVRQEVAVKPQYGLTDSEVEKMLLESLTNAQDDIQLRALSEAKNEAIQLIKATQRFIKKNHYMLSEQEQKSTDLCIIELEAAIDKDDKNLILTKHQQLNENTRSFAERIMDEAISAALKGKNIE